MHGFVVPVRGGPSFYSQRITGDRGSGEGVAETQGSSDGVAEAELPTSTPRLPTRRNLATLFPPEASPIVPPTPTVTVMSVSSLPSSNTTGTSGNMTGGASSHDTGGASSRVRTRRGLSSGGTQSMASRNQPPLLCSSCGHLFASQDNRNSHKCPLSPDPDPDDNDDDDDNEDIMILTPPKEWDVTPTIYQRYMPDPKIIEICRQNSHAARGYWPLVFPGHMRLGAQGMPPVLETYTANRESSKMLKKLLRVEQEVLLPKQILIIDQEKNVRFRLRPAQLRPTHEFLVEERRNSFVVRLDRNQDQNNNDDGAANLNIDTGSDDEEVVFNNNPTSRQPTAASTAALNDTLPDTSSGASAAATASSAAQGDNMETDEEDLLSGNIVDHLPSYFESGDDNLGAIHVLLRPRIDLRNPQEFLNWEYVDLCRMTKASFIELVKTNIAVNGRLLSAFGETMLFTLKLVQDLSHRVLARLFGLPSHSTAIGIFHRILIHQYLHNCNIPMILTPDGQVNHAEIEKMLTVLFEHMSPFYRRLADAIEDPTGQQRQGVFMNCDATYISCEGSEDVELQKLLYLTVKASHIIKWITFTSMRGKIVGILPALASQSPTCGDSYLMCMYINMLDEDQTRENIMRVLLRGNSRYFVCLITDAGFVIDSSVRNSPREIRGLPTLAQVCHEEGGVMLHTSGHFEPYKFKKLPNGKFRVVPDNEDDDDSSDDEESPTMKENRQKFSRIFRKAQEQQNSGWKHKFGMLDSKNVSSHLLLPLPPATTRRFGMPGSYDKIPRITMIMTVTCSLYNFIHPGYQLRYLRPEDEVPAADNLLHRLWVENPLFNGVFAINFETVNASGWSKVTAGTSSIIGFPTLTPDQINPVAIFLMSGPHALFKADSVLTLINEIKVDEDNLSGDQAADRLNRYPEFHQVEYRDLIEPPANWNEAEYWRWVPIRFIRSHIPPTFKAHRDSSNWHWVVIGIQLGRENLVNPLQLPAPYDQVLFINCFKCPSSIGSMAGDRHIGALLKLLSFPDTYKSTYKDGHVMATRAPQNRGCLASLPPTLQSQDIPLNVPRITPDSRGTETSRFRDLYPPGPTHSSGPRPSPRTGSTRGRSTSINPGSGGNQSSSTHQNIPSGGKLFGVPENLTHVVLNSVQNHILSVFPFLEHMVK